MQPSFKQLPPLSLYIHIPWCIKKCPYCDFNSHAAPGDIPEKHYIQSLLADLDHDLSYVQDRSLHSIFFGGGTPSLLSAAGISQILQGVSQRINLSDDIEITLEANPGTFEQDKFADYREQGINRLSIGVQSFNSSHLEHLGRAHSSIEALLAAGQARHCGFENINLDLMHGLNQQNPEQAIDDLEIAISQQPTHLSWYQLTIEPNTAFYNKPPLLPDENTLHQIEQKGQALLQLNGYQQYEISAYSLKGRASYHNLNYWRFGDYIGIGAGAHGKITQLTEQQIVRTRKTRSPKDYMVSESKKFSANELIEPSAIPAEFLMNALRMNQGFTQNLFERTTGLSYSLIQTEVTAAQEEGLIEKNGSVRATPKGRLFLNTLIERFI